MQADPSQNATMDVTLGAVQTEGNGIGTWAYQWSGPNGNIAPMPPTQAYPFFATGLRRQRQLSSPDHRRLQ